MLPDRQTFLDRLDDFCSGKLDASEQEEIERYLAAHPEDRAEVERQRALRLAFKRLAEVKAPGRLRESVLARLREEQQAAAGTEPSQRPVQEAQERLPAGHVVPMDELPTGAGRRADAASSAKEMKRRGTPNWVWPVAQIAAVLLLAIGGWRMMVEAVRIQNEKEIARKGVHIETAAAPDSSATLEKLTVPSAAPSTEMSMEALASAAAETPSPNLLLWQAREEKLGRGTLAMSPEKSVGQVVMHDMDAEGDGDFVMERTRQTPSPDFAAGQTESKGEILRASKDSRTLATSVEAYHIDHNEIGLNLQLADAAAKQKGNDKRVFMADEIAKDAARPFGSAATKPAKENKPSAAGQSEEALLDARQISDDSVKAASASTKTGSAEFQQLRQSSLQLIQMAVERLGGRLEQPESGVVEQAQQVAPKTQVVICRLPSMEAWQALRLIMQSDGWESRTADAAGLARFQHMQSGQATLWSQSPSQAFGAAAPGVAGTTISQGDILDRKRSLELASTREGQAVRNANGTNHYFAQVPSSASAQPPNEISPPPPQEDMQVALDVPAPASPGMIAGGVPSATHASPQRGAIRDTERLHAARAVSAAVAPPPPADAPQTYASRPLPPPSGQNQNLLVGAGANYQGPEATPSMPTGGYYDVVSTSSCASSSHSPGVSTTQNILMIVKIEAP